MELVPWKSFGGLSPFRKEIDMFRDRIFGGKPIGSIFGEDWAPAVDISETKNSFIVKAELPGLDAKDVTVSLSGDLLTIKGEKTSKEEEKDEHHHYVERYSGSFQRSFQLPASVQNDKVEASFDKGVLKIIIPKVAEAEKKEIEIKVK